MHGHIIAMRSFAYTLVLESCLARSLLVECGEECIEMERGPGERSIGKGDEEGWWRSNEFFSRGSKRYNTFSGLLQHKTTDREGRRTTSDLSHRICEISSHTAWSKRPRRVKVGIADKMWWVKRRM